MVARIFSRKLVLAFLIVAFCATAFSQDHFDSWTQPAGTRRLAEANSIDLQPRSASVGAYGVFGQNGKELIKSLHRDELLRSKNQEKLNDILAMLEQKRTDAFRLAIIDTQGREQESLRVPKDKLDEIELVLKGLQDLRQKSSFLLSERKIESFLTEFQKTLTEIDHPATTFRAYDQFMGELTARATSANPSFQSEREQKTLTDLREHLAILNVSIPLPPPKNTVVLEGMKKSDLGIEP